MTFSVSITKLDLLLTQYFAWLAL